MNNSIFFILLIIVLIVPMFLQKRRSDKIRGQLRQLQSSLTPGLPVVTTAGIHAVVDSVDEQAQTVDLRIAANTVITFDQAAVIRLDKTAETPAPTATESSVEATTVDATPLDNDVTDVTDEHNPGDKSHA